MPNVHEKLPAELKPEQVVAIIDTREQLPFVLDPLRVREGTLQSGDYSVVGLSDLVGRGFALEAIGEEVSA